jgi:tetratricopeptide (TPR) repeat protein
VGVLAARLAAGGHDRMPPAARVDTPHFCFTTESRHSLAVQCRLLWANFDILHCRKAACNVCPGFQKREGRGMRFSVWLAWVAAFLMLAGPLSVSRALADDVDRCEHGTGDEKIAGCTSEIDSGRWHGADLAWAYVNRGIAYHDKDDYDRAVADYTQAIKLDPKDAFAYNDRGNAYRDNGDNDRAIADFNQAIQLDPKYAFAYNGRGFAYRNKGDNDRAIADFNQAIQLDPKYANAYCNRGLAKRAQGDSGGGNADVAKAKALNPNIGSWCN